MSIATPAVSVAAVAIVAGYILAGPRRLVLPGLGVTFESDALDLTPRG